MIYGDVDRTIELLNEMLRLDPEATHKLFNTYVQVNEAILEHPTIRCGCPIGMSEQEYLELKERRRMVSILGVLNGIHGVYDEEPRKGHGPISACYDDAKRLVGFKLTRDPSLGPYTMNFGPRSQVEVIDE